MEDLHDSGSTGHWSGMVPLYIHARSRCNGRRWITTRLQVHRLADHRTATGCRVLPDYGSNRSSYLRYVQEPNGSINRDARSWFLRRVRSMGSLRGLKHRDLVGHRNGRMGLHPLCTLEWRCQGGIRVRQRWRAICIHLNEVDCNGWVGNLPSRLHDG